MWEKSRLTGTLKHKGNVFHLAEAPLAICCCSSGQGFPGARLPGCTEAGTAFPSKDRTRDGGWGGELEVGWRHSWRVFLLAVREEEGCRLLCLLSWRHFLGWLHLCHDFHQRLRQELAGLVDAPADGSEHMLSRWHRGFHTLLCQPFPMTPQAEVQKETDEQPCGYFCWNASEWGNLGTSNITFCVSLPCASDMNFCESRSAWFWVSV